MYKQIKNSRDGGGETNAADIAENNLLHDVSDDSRFLHHFDGNLAIPR
jgi:hypothetical protein